MKFFGAYRLGHHDLDLRCGSTPFAACLKMRTDHRLCCAFSPGAALRLNAVPGLENISNRLQLSSLDKAKAVVKEICRHAKGQPLDGASAWSKRFSQAAVTGAFGQPLSARG